MSELIDNDISESLYQLAKSFLIEKQLVLVSLLQRRFKIGYRRALDLMDQLEKGGVVTGPDSEGSRKLTDHPSIHIPKSDNVDLKSDAGKT